MGRLSLYANRYEEIQAMISNDTILGQNAGVVNIAGNTQRIAVECIPGGAFRDWRWRQVGNQCFAILPFYMKVYSMERMQGIQLRHCKIQLSLSASSANNATIDTAEEDQNGESLAHYGMIRLEEVPLPQDVKTNITSNGLKFWEFYSRIIHEGYSSEQAAVSWEWNNRHLLDDYPSAQHGAILISHPQAPFYLACQVSGSARKFPYQYRFSNEGIQPRWRPIIPQPPDRTVLHIRDIKGEFQDIMRVQSMCFCLFKT